MSLFKKISSYLANSCNLHNIKKSTAVKEKAKDVIKKTSDVNASSKARLNGLIATIDGDPGWFLTILKRDDGEKNGSS